MTIITISGGIFNFLDWGYSYTTWSGGVYNFNPAYITYNILAGTSNSYIAIWTDSDANISNAKMYVSSTGLGSALSVIDLSNDTLIDSYNISYGGQNDETLDREDVVDINVGI